MTMLKRITLISMALLVAHPVWAQVGDDPFAEVESDVPPPPEGDDGSRGPVGPRAAGEEEVREKEDVQSATDQSIYVVQQRAYSKAGDFEITGPFFFTKVNPKFVGYWGFAISLAYHIKENFALEFQTAIPVTGLYNAFYSDLVFEVYEYESLTPEEVDLKQMSYFGALSLQFSALYGKLELYGILLDYDFYATAGIGLASTLETCTPGKDGCGDEVDVGRGLITPDSSGDQLKVTGNLGGGMRVFFLDWIGLRLELRDIVYSDRDVEPGQVTTDIRNELMVMIGVSFMISGPGSDEVR